MDIVARYCNEPRLFGSRILGLWKTSVVREFNFVVREIFRPKRVNNDGLLLPADHKLIDSKSRRALYRNNYERPEMIAVATTLRDGDRVLELGSGIGAISSLCGKLVGSRGFLAAVEGNPALLPLIEETWRLNGVVGTPIWGLVAQHDGTADMWIGKELVSNSSVVRGEGDICAVPTLSLNRLIKEHQPTVLVIDVEGAEVEILSTARLDGVRAICMEVHPHIVGNERILDLVHLLREAGINLIIDKSSRRCLVFERA